LQLLWEHRETSIYRASNTYIQAAQKALAVAEPLEPEAHADREVLAAYSAIWGG
jgi:hypothetical protein